MRALAEGGAEPLLLPTIEIRPPEDRAALRRAARALQDFDWVVFTSVNAVRAVGDVRRGEGADARRRAKEGEARESDERVGSSPGIPFPPAGPRLAAVGPSTAEALTRLSGRPPELVPTEHSAAGLLDALRAYDEALSRRSILLPVGNLARDTLPRALREEGARVERVTAYRTTPPDRIDVERVRAAIREGRVALVTFTSPSTVENFFEAVGEEALSVPAAVIGPVTARSAREHGFRVEAVAQPSSIETLVAAALGRILQP